MSDLVSDIFGGGNGESPPPTTVMPKPTPVRVEPGEKVPSRRKRQQRSLATQLSLSEPLIKEEKLGT